MPPVRHDFGTTTSIRFAEFDPDTGRVTVESSTRPVETFENFTAELFAEWCAASKPGQWFTNRIRRNPDRYPVLGGAADPAATDRAELAAETAPPDGWHDLQPNLPPADADVAPEKAAEREERFGDGERAPSAHTPSQDKVRAALKRLADRKGE